MNEIICGDALTVLRTLPGDSVNCCCTSPPYFGLRDYNCDGQIGLEETPEQYISKLTEIFREVRRVLTPDGVCWINIGDSYAGSGKGAWTADKQQQNKNKQSYKYTNDNPAVQMPKTWAESGIKPKDMLCIPFLLALALRGDGWYLRSDVIWAKTNAMPQSVKDRLTSSYEHIFLLAKSRKYYFDHEAIKEPVTASTIERMKRGKSGSHKYTNGAPGQTPQAINNLRPNRSSADIELPTMRSKRDIWTVSTNSYREGGHYASYPVELITPCIIAGCPPGGIVLDPFIGSGTTGVAALSVGRNYIGIEINSEYCALSRERIAKHTALI